MRHFGRDSLYAALLGDRDPQFSVAYFDHPYTSIDRAQGAARRHLAAKLNLRPGMRVLDLGCGWGALAIWLARTFDVEVTGYTLAAEQLLPARDAVRKAAMTDKVRIELGDFRAIEGRFDRIIVTGAFEHVGMPQYSDYFQAMEASLAPDGLALLHSTAHCGPPRPMNPWVRKRLFPGSHVPAIDVVLEAAEQAGLWVSDLEILRLHGAETLRLWRENLRDHAWRTLSNREGDPRAWELFLSAAEMAFRYGDLMTFEAQLIRQVGAAPITRDYIEKAEAELQVREDHLVRSTPHTLRRPDHAQAQSVEPA
jgi:cyclopropane-fatty-acyl-phospholipid synthase